MMTAATTAASASTTTAAPARRGATLVLVVLAFTNLVAYATRNSLFNVYPTLRDKFGLHDAKLGLLATAFLLPHALATLAFGWAGDRFDRRRVIAFGLIVASIAGAAGALATDVTTLVITRVFVGLGTAAVVPVANSIIGQLYDGPRKASRIAVFNLGLLVGGAAGFLIGGAIGFPPVLLAFAVPGIVLALVMLVLPVPPHPGAATRVAAGSAGAGISNSSRRRATLLRIRTLRWIMLSTIAMAFSAGGYNAWLIDFLEQDKHMTQAAATRLLSIPLTGAVIGVVAGQPDRRCDAAPVHGGAAVDDGGRHGDAHPRRAPVPPVAARRAALRRRHRHGLLQLLVPTRRWRSPSTISRRRRRSSPRRAS